jgi:3',5'-nucleoside bisphosphate phosphatase
LGTPYVDRDTLAEIPGPVIFVRYDLHLHSRHSDGMLTPSALIELAHSKGVDVLALTDHDCTDGLAEAAVAARAAGMQLVPGVEISVTWNDMTIHVVGLGIRADDEVLVRGLGRLVAARHERAHEIARRLDKRRIHDAYDGAARLAGGVSLGRTHFARFLVQGGYVPSIGQAFKQYLLRGAAAYAPVQWAALDEAVGWIHVAGGQAVIAHPARYKLSNGKLRKLLGEFKACGGDAIEVVNAGQAPATNAHCAALAREFELLASVGSDYHGPDTPWIEPGKLAPLPEGCVPVWQNWQQVTSAAIS